MRGWEDGPRRRRRLGAARLAGTHGWGPWDASQARQSSAKGKGRVWSSHRSLKRRGRDAGRVGGDGGADLADEPLQGASGSAGASRRSARALQRGSGVQGGRSTSGGEKTGWRSLLPAARSWVKFGACGAKIKKGWPGENSGRRGGASARPGRSSDASGQCGSSGAEERHGGARRGRWR